MTWVNDLISAVVDTFIGITAGMADGVTVLFENLLTDSVTGGLTVFGQFAFVILGLGLATGLFYSLVGLIRRRG